MAKGSLPLVVLDPGHGGSDPGAVAKHGDNSYKEKVLARAVVKLLYGKLMDGGNVRVMTTFEAAGKDSDSYWHARNRGAFLRNYNKNTERIDYLLSIHLNAAKETASGLVICHNNRENEAQSMYDSMVEFASLDGFDKVAGNRVEKIQDRPGLAILRASILGIFNKNGLKIPQENANEFSAYFKEATDAFKKGAGNVDLSTSLANGVSQLISGIKSMQGRQLDNAKMEALGKKENPINTEILGMASAYSDEGTTMLHMTNDRPSAASGEGARIPALLIETGFITNNEDCTRIAEHPDLYANWIGGGLYKIIGI